MAIRGIRGLCGMGALHKSVTSLYYRIFKLDSPLPRMSRCLVRNGRRLLVDTPDAKQTRKHVFLLYCILTCSRIKIGQ